MKLYFGLGDNLDFVSFQVSKSKMDLLVIVGD